MATIKVGTFYKLRGNDNYIVFVTDIDPTTNDVCGLGVDYRGQSFNEQWGAANLSDDLIEITSFKVI